MDPRRWERAYSDLDGQLVLPGLQYEASDYEHLFVALARAWENRFRKVPANRPPSEDLGELALCALQIAHFSTTLFTSDGQQTIERNIELTLHRGVGGWLDRLPWEMARQCPLTVTAVDWQARDLIANLNHHNSGIRRWMMEIAWVLRHRLPREIVVPILLENVESTLLYPDMAWGLAATLYEDRAAFHEAADAYLPRAIFAEQYAERAQRLRCCTLDCQVIFWKLEASIFRRILQYAATAPM